MNTVSAAILVACAALLAVPSANCIDPCSEVNKVYGPNPPANPKMCLGWRGHVTCRPSPANSSTNFVQVSPDNSSVTICPAAKRLCIDSYERNGPCMSPDHCPVNNVSLRALGSCRHVYRCANGAWTMAYACRYDMEYNETMQLCVPAYSPECIVASPTTTAPSSTKAPITTTMVPITTTKAPITTTMVPIITTMVPNTTTNAPLTTTKAPITTTIFPSTTTNAPITATKAPITTTKAPITTTKAPLTTTKAPITTSKTPITTTKAPVTTTKSPITTTKAPITTTKAPVTTTKAPITTVAPTTPTVTPEVLPPSKCRLRLTCELLGCYNLKPNLMDLLE